MEKYILTSQAFKGSVVFGFVGDLLTLYHNESEMTDAQIKWLLKNLPLDKSKLENVRPQQGKLELIPPDLSFDAFWDGYGKKINKKRTEMVWNKMSDPAKIECLMSIEPYDNYLRRMVTRPKKDPENYLKLEFYKNNWNALKS